MPAAAAISGVASLLGQGLNSLSSAQAAETSFERQKDLMALQNQYAVANWNRENNYNSPQEQMKRLKAAGLNPNLVYGNGAAGLQANPISAPSAPAAPMQVTAPGNFGSVLSDSVNAALGIAQAKKANAETVGQKIENDFLGSTLTERTRAVALANKYTEQQTKQAVEQTALITQQYGVLVAQQNILSTERQIRDKELENWQKRFDAEMRQFEDQHKLSHEEYRRLEATFEDFKKMFAAQANEAEWSAKIQQLLYESDSQFKNFERSTGILAPFIQMLIRCFGGK